MRSVGRGQWKYAARRLSTVGVGGMVGAVSVEKVRGVGGGLDVGLAGRDESFRRKIRHKRGRQTAAGIECRSNCDGVRDKTATVTARRKGRVGSKRTTGGRVWDGVGLSVPIAAGRRDRARGAESLDGGSDVDTEGQALRQKVVGDTDRVKAKRPYVDCLDSRTNR